MRLTRSPRDSRRQPMEAAARPLPSEDTTPPVTKMYFADIFASPEFVGFGWTCRAGTSKYRRNPGTREVGTQASGGGRAGQKQSGAAPRIGKSDAGWGSRAGGGR